MPDIRWDWISRHADDILNATLDHLLLVVISIGAAIAIAIPLAVAVHPTRLGRAIAASLTTAVYTIPSVALFAVLVAFVGIGRTPAVIGLAAYALVVLVRNTLTGLSEVSAPVLDAARGMGMSHGQLLRHVRLPLALPAILTGVRLATVETVAIATIAVFIAGGGLGEIIYTDGISRDLFLTPILAGTVMAVALALALDLILVTLLRVATRWQRAGGVG